MPTIDFERLDWEDYPSTETPLSAENLNRLEDAMEGIYDDVGGQEQAISNILGNFAYVEPTAVASKDYLAGDLLVRGDYMYKAIIPIQTDDALVEGTNITKTTVSSELGVDVFSNFAYIERSNVATKNYTVGSHVLLNNILYVVTSAVETGENLVVDMNIEQTTVCDELEKETGSVASAVGYDNTTSGLTATNVQDAVDELASPAAEGVSYDNTESGLTATNVQGAVDEVNSKTSQTPTLPAYVELLQNQSAVYPNGQKLLQVQLHFTSAVSANWAILGIPTALRSNKYVAVSVINSNTGDVYGAVMNNDLLFLMKAAPAGWYVISVMYE